MSASRRDARAVGSPVSLGQLWRRQIMTGAGLVAALLSTSVQADPITVFESEAADRALGAWFTPGPSPAPAPLVVLLTGLPGDAPLGASAPDYLEQGYAVLQIDFGEAAVSIPAMMRDILTLRRRIAAEMAPEVDADRMYIVPETHTLVADQPFFAHGGFTYRMDVLHSAAGPAPTALQISHRVEGRRQTRTFTAYDDALLDGLALRGFTVALADHHGADAPELRVDRMPLLVDHGRAALSALGAEARDWNVDVERILVVGFSKGGAAAALIAGAQNDDQVSTPAVRGAVVFSAYLDQSRLIEDGLDPGSSRWSDSLAAWGNPAAAPGEWRRNSAITYVDPGDPPMLLVAGADDSYRPSQARRMAAALERAGVPYHSRSIPELGHRLPGSDADWRIVFDFVEAALADLPGRRSPSRMPEP